MTELDNEEWEQYPTAWIEKVKKEVNRIEAGIALDTEERGADGDTKEPSREEEMWIPWQSAFPQTDRSRKRYSETDMGMEDRSEDSDIEMQNSGRGSERRQAIKDDGAAVIDTARAAQGIQRRHTRKANRRERQKLDSSKTEI